MFWPKPKKHSFSNRLTATQNKASRSPTPRSNRALSPRKITTAILQRHLLSADESFNPRPNTPRHLQSADVNLQPPENKVRISQIPAMEDLKDNLKLRLNNQQQTKINYAINVEKVANEAVAKRCKQNKLFLDYNVNPLVPQGVQNEAEPSKTQTKKQKKNKALTEALVELRDADNRAIINQRVNREESPAEQFIKLNQHRENIHKRKGKTGGGKENQQYIEKAIFDMLFNATLPEKQSDAIEELQRLVKRKDENDFLPIFQKRNINIFMINENPHHPDFDSCSQVLFKNHFCQDSMVKASKHTYNVFKDFSTYSRKMAQGFSQKIGKDYKVSSSDLSYNPEALGFKEVIMMAEGKLQPDVAWEFTNLDAAQNMRILDGSEVGEEAEIVFRENGVSNGVRVASDSYRESELTQFRQQKYTKKQNKQLKLSTFYLDRMKKILKDESLSIRKRIMDNQQHGDFMRQREQIIEEQWEAGTDKQVYEKRDIEKKIKDLKINKDKRQSIKARVITQTLKAKRKIEQEINTIRTGPAMRSREKQQKSLSIKRNEPITKWRY